ncbi:hypothetical protein AB0G86_14000 [Streptomyces scabiei]|uniref:hypothetical protein n=1 Tax=Streptomyces scabiei TaxID=1930 RepID=UPI0033C91092
MPVRDGISDGFLTRPAHDSHPVDLMCLYLLHGSLERIPGLPADRETLSFEQLSSHVRAEHRSGSPFGAPVDLSRFMHHLRGHHAPAGAPGDWDFGVVTDARDLRESVVRFGNGREVWFQVGDHRAEWFRGGTGGRPAERTVPVGLEPGPAGHRSPAGQPVRDAGPGARGRGDVPRPARRGRGRHARGAGGPAVGGQAARSFSAARGTDGPPRVRHRTAPSVS